MFLDFSEKSTDWSTRSTVEELKNLDNIATWNERVYVGARSGVHAISSKIFEYLLFKMELLILQQNSAHRLVSLFRHSRPASRNVVCKHFSCATGFFHQKAKALAEVFYAKNKSQWVSKPFRNIFEKIFL